MRSISWSTSLSSTSIFSTSATLDNSRERRSLCSAAGRNSSRTCCSVLPTRCKKRSRAAASAAGPSCSLRTRSISFSIEHRGIFKLGTPFEGGDYLGAILLHPGLFLGFADVVCHPLTQLVEGGEALADLTGKGVVEGGQILFLDLVDMDAAAAGFASEVAIAEVFGERQFALLFLALFPADERRPARPGRNTVEPSRSWNSASLRSTRVRPSAVMVTSARSTSLH